MEARFLARVRIGLERQLGRFNLCIRRFDENGGRQQPAAGDWGLGGSIGHGPGNGHVARPVLIFHQRFDEIPLASLQFDRFAGLAGVAFVIADGKWRGNAGDVLAEGNRSIAAQIQQGRVVRGNHEGVFARVGGDNIPASAQARGFLGRGIQLKAV